MRNRYYYSHRRQLMAARDLQTRRTVQAVLALLVIMGLAIGIAGQL